MNSHIEPLLLSEYADQELSAENKSAVEFHLQSCALCKTELAHFLSVKSLLKTLPKQRIPVALVTALEARAQEKLEVGRWIDWVLTPQVWVSGMALGIGLAALTLWIQPALKNEIPIESVLAAHDRYEEETLLPSSDLSAGEFSAKLAACDNLIE